MRRAGARSLLTMLVVTGLVVAGAAAGQSRTPVTGDLGAAPAPTRSADYVRTEVTGSPLAALRREGRVAARRGEPVLHHVYASIAAVTPSTTDDVRTQADLTRAKVEAAVAELSAYYLEESGGRIAFDLVGYETRSWNRTGCTRDGGLDLAGQLSFDGAALDPAWGEAGNHVLALSLEGVETCGGAMALFPGSVVFQNEGVEDLSDENAGLSVLFHEFGHNLGFGHADAGMCRSSAYVDAPLPQWYDDHERPDARCPYQEYGDWQDIMGFSNVGAHPHISALQRYLAGWLEGSVVQPTLGTTQVTLRALDDSSGTRAVAVTDPRTGQLYVVEYRTMAGEDATSREFTDPVREEGAANYFFFDSLPGDRGDTFARWIFDTPAATGGVRILRLLYGPDDTVRHDERYPHFQESLVLAVGTSTYNRNVYNRNAHLDAGESFTSSSGGIRVLASSLDPATGARLTVTTSRAPSRTSLVVADRSLRPGQEPQLRVQVTAPAASSVTGSLTVLVDGAPAATLDLAGTAGAASFTVPAVARVGRHRIQVAYSGSSSADPSRSAPVRVTVR